GKMYSHFRWFLSPRISFLNCASWFPFSVHYGYRKLCTMVPDFCASLFAEGCALLFPDYNKSYSRSKPLKIEEFELEKKWWNKRKETKHSWKVSAKEVRENGYSL